MSYFYRDKEGRGLEVLLGTESDGSSGATFCAFDRGKILALVDLPEDELKKLVSYLERRLQK